MKIIHEGVCFKDACEDFWFFQSFENSRETMEDINALCDEARKSDVDIRKLTRLPNLREFVVPCAIPEVEFPVLSVSSIEITEDLWPAVVSHIDLSVKSDVKKLDNQVVQTAEAVQNQDALIKEKAEESERHQGDAIIDDDFRKVVK